MSITLDKTLPAVSLLIGEAVRPSLNLTLPPISLEATSYCTSSSLSIELLPISLDATLYCTSSSITIELPAVSLNATSYCTSSSLNIELPAISLEAISYCTSSSLNIELPTIELSISSYGAGAKIVETLPAIQLYGYVVRTEYGRLNKILPAISLTAVANVQGVAVVQKTLPAIILESRISPNSLFLVLNPTTTAITEYSLTPVSLAVKDGVVYLSDGSAIYTLDGNDDNGSNIASEIQLGLSDVDTNILKRITDIFMSVRTDGQMKLYLIDDENVSTTARTIESTSDKIKTQRAKMPLGNKCSYYSLKVENVEGSDFEIAKIIVSGRLSRSRRFYA